MSLKGIIDKFRGKEETKSETALRLLKENWHFILLLMIFAMSFSVRYIPAQHGELQALDPFYIYRMGEYMLENNLQLPELDMMRYHPIGLPTRQFEYPGPFYIPVLMYLIFFAPFGMTFWSFAFVYSPLMGALSVVIMYFIAEELFSDKKAGLFAAFFLATVPGFITRTSAGFFEKEPGGAPFMLFAVYFFIKAYKNNSWKHGILGGISMGIMAVTWGGSGYMMLFFALCSFILLLLNKYSDGLLKGMVPIALLGTLFPFVTQRSIDLGSTTVLVPVAVAAFVIARYAVEKYKILKEEQVPYFAPGAIVVGVAGLLIGATQSAYLWDKINAVWTTLMLSKGVIGTTVAENAPGSWNDVMNMFGSHFSAGMIPQTQAITGYFSIWLLMFLGTAFMLYEIYKTKNMIYVIPLVWLVTTVWATLGFVRLMFLLGPPAALAAGFFFAELVRYSSKIKLGTDIKKGNSFTVTIPQLIALILVILAILINTSSAIVFTSNIGPSYNGYFDEAMTYMKEETPEGSSILSWWDFGYWFQSRGERPSVADGGNVGDAERKYGYRNFYIADWFIDDASNWTSYYDNFLRKYDVDYILMDYTLPGKYGAISKIGSRGDTIVGMMQFSQSGSYQKDNKTIYQFSARPYELWIPINQMGGVDGRPIFLAQQNGMYSQRMYVNDMCTAAGIIRLGNSTSDTIPGCVAMTPFGVFYVPEEAENTIFTRLMFMDGFGLEGLTKEFENGAVRIYKLNLPPAS